MKPEAALESAARLKEKVAALCRLERSLVSEHTSMRDAAQHRGPRYSEWLALRNELGAPADEARALLAHLEALAKPYLAIRDYLFAANKRLVFSCIPKQHYGRHFSEDLIQAGDIGLLRAVERFDPASGYQFSTCGRLWIKQQMLVFFRDQFNLIRVPSHLVKAATQLKRMLEEGASSSSLSAHASELGLPLDQQRALLRLTRPIVSIFNPVDKSQNRLANLITAPSSDSATSLFAAQEAAQRVNDVLRFLNPRLRFIIVSRFGIERPEGLTLEEIGRTLKVTKERVRQLERKAIKRLYSILMRQGGSSSAEEN